MASNFKNGVKMFAIRDYDEESMEETQTEIDKFIGKDKRIIETRTGTNDYGIVLFVHWEER